MPPLHRPFIMGDCSKKASPNMKNERRSSYEKDHQYPAGRRYGHGPSDRLRQQNSGSTNDNNTPNNNQTTELSGSVATNGSTSMDKVIGALREQFMTDHKNVTVTYDPTGSGSGIEAVKNGTADIGLASRSLKDEEKAGGLTETVIALDGIAVIVHAQNKVTDLTVEQIAKIFTGEITDWSQVGGDPGAISCIGRESGSGTRDGFESITGTKDSCKLDQELTSTGGVIEAVAGNQTPSAMPPSPLWRARTP